MLRAYNTLLLPLWPVVELWASWRSLDAQHAAEWRERCARQLPLVGPGACWIHGASLGEARIVGGLAGALRAARPALKLAVSAFTPAGRAQLPAPPAVDAAFFLPLDFPGFHRRLLAVLRPSALCLVETELWPNLLAEAASRDVPVVVLNARLSKARMKRYRRFLRLYGPLLENLAGVGAQSENDAERFLELGVPARAIEVTGNVKYDCVAPSPVDSPARAKLAPLGARSIWLAGSTGEGEEPQVFEAFQQVRRKRPDLLLILAPRHPARLGEIERHAAERRLRMIRLSRLSHDAREVDVVLVDTLGELSSMYGMARVAFVGGSLVPIGGHNVLEPAALGVPVLFGPYTHNVSEPAAALERAGGAFRVGTAEELGRALERLLEEPVLREAMGRAAAEVVREHRGALGRSVALLLAVLDRRSAGRTEVS